ncbi:MAG TPA: SUMF1/EgtB/PvdO family nonheme iron enzyme [Pyrinomonadaceae bacterium]
MKISKFINRLFAVNLIILLLWQLVLTQTTPGVRQLSRDRDKSDSAKRIALVIGIATYTNAKPLPNPANDADDMTATLKTLGFEVFSGTNQNKRQIETLIRQFGKRLAETKGTGLFYYAGHGVQVNGENFLVPVDAEIPEEVDVRYAAVSINYVLDNMRWAENDLNIVILDACRNNPFARSWTRKRAADEDKGLARISPPQGTVVMYATQPGDTADDGKGRNGLFTSVLLKEIKKPNVELDSMIKAVTRGVLDASKALSKTQYPWREGSYVGDFYFAVKEAGNTAAKPETSKPAIDDSDPNFGTAADAKTVEREVFRSIQNSTDIGELRAVLEEYPTSQYAAGARLKLEQLVWNSVKDSKDKAKILAYLNEFKDGANAPLARIKLRQLEAATAATNAVPPVNNPPAVRKAGEISKSKLPNGVEMSFAYVPAGSFKMGSTKGEDDEKPVHIVTISQGFWIGQTEVTQGQWKAVMGNNPSYFSNCGDNCPVEMVSWDDAQQFIAKLNSQNEGYKYRLPTEAEWEYAARAGTTGDYAGNLDLMGWYNENSHRTMHPVGQKQSNAWNLYDMYGNVMEWCEDWYDKNYYSKSPSNDPPGASSSSYRVARSGGWGFPAKMMRSAARHRIPLLFRSSFLGFRVVRVAL